MCIHFQIIQRSMAVLELNIRKYKKCFQSFIEAIFYYYNNVAVQFQYVFHKNTLRIS